MTDKNDNSIVQITLSNRIGYEKIAMACSASFAEIFGFPQNRIEDLKTIVGEASTNAMRHGNNGRADAKVRVSLSCKDNTIRVSVEDEGPGFEKLPSTPDLAQLIKSKEKTVGGFGLFLINQLADEVEFNKKAGKGHVIHLSLNMKAQADHAK